MSLLISNLLFKLIKTKENGIQNGIISLNGSIRSILIAFVDVINFVKNREKLQFQNINQSFISQIQSNSCSYTV